MILKIILNRLGLVLFLFASSHLNGNAQNSTLSWVKQFGGKDFDTGLSIELDSSGNIYAVGGFSDTTDFDPGPAVSNLISNGEQDVFIIKMDSAGNVIWVKSMGGPGLDQAKDLSFDNNNNLIVTGIFENTVDFDPNNGVMNLTSAGIYDIFIQKFDVNGNLIWAKRIGGNQFDVAEAVVTDNANNIYITGDFQSTVDFDPGSGTLNKTANGSRDIFVLKLLANGDLSWVNQHGAVGLNDGYSMCIDKNRNALYTTGQFLGSADFDPGSGSTVLTSNGDRDIYVQRLDTAGKLDWARQIGGVDTDGGTSVTVDASGNVLLTGFFEGTVDFDPGNGVNSLTSLGSYDAFVLKLNKRGRFVWVRPIGGSGFIQGHKIVTDQYKHVYTIGRFHSTVDFDPGPGTSAVSGNGPADIFIQKLDSSGAFLGVDHIGGIAYDFGNGLVIGSNEEIYLTGGFGVTVDFDPSMGTSNLTSNGSSDIFIQKLNQSSIVGMENQVFRQELSVYPNPTKGEYTIQFGQVHKEVTVRLISVLGQIIESKDYQNVDQINLDIEEARGIYLVEITIDSRDRKLISLVKD